MRNALGTEITGYRLERLKEAEAASKNIKSKAVKRTKKNQIIISENDQYSTVIAKIEKIPLMQAFTLQYTIGTSLFELKFNGGVPTADAIKRTVNWMTNCQTESY